MPSDTLHDISDCTGHLTVCGSAARARKCRSHGDSAASVGKVRVLGVNRTKDDALVKECAGLYKARCLKELVRSAHLAAAHMRHVGLFTQVVPYIDVSATGKRDTYDVVFLTDEARPVRGTISIGMDNRGETQGTVQFDAPSTFGRGEAVAGQASAGVRGSTLFNISSSKPLLGWQRYTNLSGAAFRSNSGQPFSSFTSADTGVHLELYHRTLKRFDHSVRWTGSWREIKPEPSATFSVRQHAGHSLKSSLTHTLGFSTQDSAVLPTRGVLLRLTQELAGAGPLGGDVKFLSHQFDAKATAPLAAGFFMTTALQLSSVSARGGRRLSLLDRVYLGGPTSLRGFGQARAGPADGHDALGGAASWAVAGHLFRPLFPAHIMFLHGFVTAGNVLPAGGDLGRPVAAPLGLLFDQARVAVGLGLAVKLGDTARLELNYCVPLRHIVGVDQCKSGFQFGAGVSFL